MSIVVLPINTYNVRRYDDRQALIPTLKGWISLLRLHYVLGKVRAAYDTGAEFIDRRN